LGDAGAGQACRGVALQVSVFREKGTEGFEGGDAAPHCVGLVAPVPREVAQVFAEEFGGERLQGCLLIEPALQKIRKDAQVFFVTVAGGPGTVQLHQQVCQKFANGFIKAHGRHLSRGKPQGLRMQ